MIINKNTVHVPGTCIGGALHKLVLQSLRPRVPAVLTIPHYPVTQSIDTCPTEFDEITSDPIWPLTCTIPSEIVKAVQRAAPAPNTVVAFTRYQQQTH